MDNFSRATGISPIPATNWSIASIAAIWAKSIAWASELTCDKSVVAIFLASSTAAAGQAHLKVGIASCFANFKKILVPKFIFNFVLGIEF